MEVLCIPPFKAISLFSVMFTTSRYITVCKTMSKCQALLEKLDIPKEPTNTEDPRLKELQDEVNELKNIIKQASSMVPPPMKQMLPQNMQNVMKEVDQ